MRRWRPGDAHTDEDTSAGGGKRPSHSNPYVPAADRHRYAAAADTQAHGDGASQRHAHAPTADGDAHSHA
jgi:hypothetical protein